MPDENQRHYEIVFILSPTLQEEEIGFFEQEIEKNIKNLEGDLKKKKNPEKRNLAYPIKKFESGYYLVINFLFNPEKLKELTSTFARKKEILRYVINHIEEPSPAKIIKDEKKKLKAKKIEKIAKEITEEEIKKTSFEKKPSTKPGRGPAEDKAKLEEIDKKLNEILEI